MISQNTGIALADNEIPDSIRKFIFDYVDSAELLDVLALIISSRPRSWDAAQITAELRANIKSIEGRLLRLEQVGLVERSGGSYSYRPKGDELGKSAEALALLYATKKHRILGLVFSPLRQIQSIANAFIFSTEKRPGDDHD